MVSFRSVDNRIAGMWRVESFRMNGVDSMEFLRRNKLDGGWDIYKQQYSSNRPLYIRNSSPYLYRVFWASDKSNHSAYINFHFQLREKNRQTEISYDTVDWVFKNTWLILRLKENEMKITTDWQGNRYDMHFKPY